MKNLPIVSQSVLRNCKVFAIAGMLSLCCACGGSEPADNPEGNVSSSPVSGEVDVKGDEVQSASGEATAEENKTEQTSQAVANGNSSESEPAEVADNGSDNQAQAKQPAVVQGVGHDENIHGKGRQRSAENQRQQAQPCGMNSFIQHDVPPWAVCSSLIIFVYLVI